MLRTFNQHDIRNTFSLDGWWDFVTEKDRKQSRVFPGRFPRQAYIPCAWEIIPGLESYRGRAWFRTRVPGEPGTAMRLAFGGVSHTGRVFVDRKEIGSHYDAFTPWDVLTPECEDREYELLVEVDNTFGEHSALHIGNDYYTYGGITRPVDVQYVPEVYVDRMTAVPRRKGKTWDLEVRIVLKNWSEKRLTRLVRFLLNDQELDLGRVTVSAGKEREISTRLTGLTVREWSVENPHLHEITALLFDRDLAVDDLTDRVGFREVKVRGSKILFNGKPVRLRGYNRHEDHPHYGCAIPVESMVRDLNMISDLGCNFVRTCHYPNDQRFLDLCDEMGFFVWEESHARHVDFSHPAYRKQIEDSTREMITRHFNHPSIIIWGTLNECEAQTASGRKEHARVLSLMRKLDDSRPVTFADNTMEKNQCAGLVDIISWNIYTGWYGDMRPDQAEDRLKEMLAWLKSSKSKGGKGKPVIISEFGAGAIYGNRNPSRVRWTEEYQAEILDHALKTYLNHPAVSGAAIWQFADCRVTEENQWWFPRPRTYNNKGTVDEYRRPKLCYEIVKKRMKEARDR